MGSCLDLSKPESINLLELAEVELKKKGKKIKDSILINLVAEKIQADTVRGYIVKRGHPVVEGSRIPRDIEVIICVRNPKKVISFEKYKEGEI